MTLATKHILGPMDAKRDEYCRRFKIFPKNRRQQMRMMKASFIDQLDRCADDSARRVLLGIGRAK